MFKIVWKDIDNYKGLYKISNTGLIKSVRRNELLKLCNDAYGYLKVTLCKNNNKKQCKVHRLVCETFLKIPNYKLDVNHIDGDKKNNKISNLEWVTKTENMRHFKRKIQNKKRGLRWAPELKKWQVRININGKMKHFGYFKNKEKAYDCFYKTYKEIFGSPPWSLKSV